MRYSYQITNTIIHYVAEIAELIGQLTASTTSKNPMLRRTNRIRTIHGSLAIEQNTLSLEQVTAVLGGKHVLAPPKDIAEVKNAYEIYERLPQLNPYSIDDLLAAHKIMTRDLVQESGMFHSKPVGVVDQQGNILHFGTLPAYVPQLVEELMDWTKNSDFATRNIHVFWTKKNVGFCNERLRPKIFREKAERQSRPIHPRGG